jgi:serine/threonine protein kinase
VIEVGDLIESRYELLQRTGMGPLTIAYLARDTGLDRLVMVKVLRPEFAAHQEAAHRFQQEAHRIRALSHPNLAAVYAVGADGEALYLVTEYLAAGSLRDRLGRDGTMTVDGALHVAIAMAAGLGAYHVQDIAHGDVKPQNVMFTEQKNVKVTDGGMGRVWAAARREPDRPLREPATFLTPEEVAGQPLTSASDVYAVGLTLYEMLAGHPPFLGSVPLETALMHLRQEVPALQEQNPRVPAPLAHIIHKALSKDPRNRYASAQQLHHILLTYQHQRAELDRRIRRAPASTPQTEAPPEAEPLFSQPATTADHALPSTEESEYAQEPVDWPFVLLGFLVVLAVLGLIILWTAVYRRYTMSLG